MLLTTSLVKSLEVLLRAHNAPHATLRVRSDTPSHLRTYGEARPVNRAQESQVINTPKHDEQDKPTELKEQAGTREAVSWRSWGFASEESSMPSPEMSSLFERVWRSSGKRFHELISDSDCVRSQDEGSELGSEHKKCC